MDYLGGPQILLKEIRHRQRRGESHVKAEAGVLQSPEADEARKEPPLETSGSVALLIL